MRLLHEARELARGLFRRREEEREMDEEIAYHLDLQTEENVRRGMSPEEARRQAVIAFGGVERSREAVRDEWRIPVMEDVWRDLAYAARTLRRSPGYSATIVLTLALGIGASVAIQTVVRGLVTDAVPFPAPDRLLSVDVTGERGEGLNPTYQDFKVWEAEAGGVVTLGGHTFGSRTVGDGSRTAYARGARVTGGFFPALAVRPLLGRTLGPSDLAPGSEPIVVLGYRTWAGPLAGDPGIVGRPILLDGMPHTVVGVLPQGYEFPTGTDLWVPLLPEGDEANSLYLGAIGRLRPGATEEEARVALETIQSGLDAERPTEERASQVSILPLTGRWSESALQSVLLLQIAVLSLLLIGTAGASGLMLTRGLERQHEIAIRASLGASRWRIVRELFAESSVLALAAGGLSLLIAFITIGAIRLGPSDTFVRNNLLGWDLLRLDTDAVLYALLLTGVAAIVLGLLPALRAVGGDLTAGIRDGAPTATTGRGRSRLLRLFLSGEVALALLLLMTAGLLTRSLFELLRLDPGYRTEDLLTVRWSLPEDRYESGDAVERFQAPLLERLRAIPGIRSAGVVSNLPTSRFGPGNQAYQVQGSDPASEPYRARWRSVDPAYLETLGVPLLKGRHISPADGPGAPRVAVVSRSLVDRHWPQGIDPLGARLEIDGEAWTVVGVAEDVLDGQRSLAPTMYVPQRQSPTTSGFLVAQVSGNAAGLAARIRQEIWTMDPNFAVDEAQTIDEVLRDTYANERTLALLVGVFAMVALVITIVSLYALVAHEVARREREIGIRLALGALPRQILAGSMGHGMLWVAVGGVLGMLLAAAVAKLAGSMLYGIEPNEPSVFVLVPAGLLTLAALASFIPARRAARTDPTISLRRQ